MKICYVPIGIIHTPFTHLDKMPIQPISNTSAPGTVEVYPEYSAGLKDLEGFSHLILLYHLHKTHRYELLVTPFLDDQLRGLFATRAPKRPNPIGLSVVPLLRMKDNLLEVDKLDVLDGTPLLDIKPYIPDFDEHIEVRIGWLEKARVRMRQQVSDHRFSIGFEKANNASKEVNRGF